jgi:internalin A
MNPTALQRIDAAREARSTELDLSGLDLDAVPESLSSLVLLKRLILDRNGLSELPSWLGQLNCIEEVRLSSNRLVEVPAVLKAWPELRSLFLDGNEIETLPPWLVESTRLQVLFVQGNPISDPTTLRAIVPRAKALGLSQGLFEQLASELSDSHVSELVLAVSDADPLVNQLMRLTSLRTLELKGELSALPEELGQLTQLQQLDVSDNQLSALPEALDQLTQLRLLNVSINQLGALPESLGQLTQLQQLDVGGNRLSALPESLGQLTQLQQLDVSHNQITTLPETLGQLTQLRQLQVLGNRLSALPEALGHLTQLQSLDVWGNEISALPEALGQLTQLQQLDVSGNQIGALPEVLGRLTQLHRLDVWGNRLTALPETLGQLTRLQQLDVSGNQLSALPDALGQLTQLRQLDISGNQLSALPESLDRLTQLQQLNASNNQLSALAESLGQLTQLQELDISGNRLNALPEALGQLTQLQRLDISNNQLSVLPESLGLLTQMQLLDVSGNHLSVLPEALRTVGGLETLRARANRLERLPEGLARCRNLNSLDLSDNALSSLPQALLELDLTTLWLQGNPALGLSSSVLGKYEGENELRRLATRQRDPRSILEAFFASRALDSQPLNEVKMVLVGRGSAGKTSIVRRLVKGTFSRSQKETQGIDIARWPLRCGGREVRVNIWDFAGQVVTHATHQFFLSESSVYVLVLTGREDTQKIDADYWLKLIRAFAADDQGLASPVIIVLNKFDDHPFKVDRLALRERHPFIVGFVETDCKSARGIAELKALVAQTVDAMPMVRQTFKRSWWKIKGALERAQRKENYLPYSGFQRICAKHGETEPSRQRFLADVFHALGVALNYGRDVRLRDATVLNPRWVTEGIYKLLRIAVPDDGTGLLTIANVKSVLPAEPDHMQRYLIALMHRFDLAFPLNESDDQWLVPQRLPAEQPPLGSFGESPAEATRLRFTYPVIPEGLVPRFIARTYPLSEGQSAGVALPRWAGGVVLALGEAWALVRVYSDERRVVIVVNGPREPRLELLGVIQSDFRTIHRDIKGLEEKEELEVEGRPGIYVDVQTLRADERQRNQSSASTPGGTVQVNPTQQLNRLSEQPARQERVSRPRVFISYSSSNARLKDELLIRLKPLKETHGLLDSWDDRCIAPGGDWDREIRRELEVADVVLLLVSARFIESDYVRDVEIKRAVERANGGWCIVVPIILEKVDWTDESFGKFNAIPRKGKPVRSFNPQSDAWFEVGRELRLLLERLCDRHGASKPQRSVGDVTTVLGPDGPFVESPVRSTR